MIVHSGKADVSCGTIGWEESVGGSGLGLAICKHIIEAHRQVIHVRSAIDVGTTFGFTLRSKKD